MLTKIFMPASGQTTNEAVLVRWLKKIGERVKQGDALFEIETDKAVTEVESYAEGVLLKINYPAGETVTAGAVVAYLGEQGELIPPLNPPVNEGKFREARSVSSPRLRGEKGGYCISPAENNFEKPAEPILPYPEESVSRFPKVLASPAARSLAKNEQVDLQAVAQQSSQPVVKKADVRRYLETIRNVPEEACEIIKLTPMRKMIAQRMTESVTTIPQFTAAIDIEMTACSQLRTRFNANLRSDGVPLAWHDLIIKCVAKALEKYPLINATFCSDHLKVPQQVNFGLAVSLADGVVAPVIKQANQKSLAAIAQETARHIERARNAQLAPADLEGGTITLSNLGMFGVECFTALIQPPQSCILAMGQIAEKPVSREGQIVSRLMMTLTAAFDHRVIDGAFGAAFLQHVQLLLEQPELALF